MNDAEFKRQILDKISPSFCAAKWYNATIWLGSGMTTSCHHPPAHLVDIDKVGANPMLLHNTPEKKQDRALMQLGQRPRGCEYCWKIEDINSDSLSDRVYKSKIYPVDSVIDAAKIPSGADVNLKTLEISFDRTCQFACSYCNPAFSTTWAKDINTNGAYQGLGSDGRNHFTHPHNSAQLFKPHETNPYINAFFAWWDSDLHRTLQELRITGGEPLMSPHTWRLIEWFKNNPGRTNTKLAINSNLGMTDAVQRLLASTRGIELDVYTSNESLLDHAEYIRSGLDWVVWVSNMQQLLNSHQLRGVHVMCTINALCLESLPEFLELLMDWKEQHGRDFPSFTLNILRFPSFQSALVLPKSIKQKHASRLANWLQRWEHSALLHPHELNHVQRLIDYLDNVDTPHSGAAELSKLQRDFYLFYQQYDQRRNKDFSKTFPGLIEWYNDIQL